MYHEDRLGGGGFARVVLAGASLRRTGRRRLAAARARGAPRRRASNRSTSAGAVALRDRIAAAPELLDALAPAIGVLLRERVA